MRIDSESDGVPRLCEENDSRLTRVGAFLRNHHLDEFPQLWNVLKGDMSVVVRVPNVHISLKRIMDEYPDYRMLFYTASGVVL